MRHLKYIVTGYIVLVGGTLLWIGIAQLLFWGINSFIGGFIALVLTFVVLLACYGISLAIWGDKT